MSVTCDNVQNLVSGFSLVEKCDVVKNGMLRLATPFQYPNGEKIDLFLGRQDHLFEKWILTDLGQTTAYLLDLHIKPWTTKRRKQLVSDICSTLDVQSEGGQFQIVLSEQQLPEVSEAMVRLAQTCIRVSDLALTQRLRASGIFREDFEEFLDAVDVPYESPIILPGQFGKQVEIDFRVQGQRVSSLVQTLSTANPVASHQMSTEAFRRWYDLANQRNQHQFVSVYDTSTDSFRDDDLARLASVSTLIGYPAEQEQLKATLAA